MIYLDYNATTPVLPEVLEAMMPYLTSEWGNPSSTYKFGSKLKTVIETARAQVAELIGAHAMEIIFTSCATESNNAAVHAALKANPRKKHIVTSMVEHSSVLNYCMALEKEGYQVTYLPVDRDGLLKLADLENAITEETAVVSLMWANNETGVLFPVKEITDTCRSRGVIFHCDAVQAAENIERTPPKIQSFPL
jgi:cysteine desulfurase